MKLFRASLSDAEICAAIFEYLEKRVYGASHLIRYDDVSLKVVDRVVVFSCDVYLDKPETTR